MKHYSPPAFEQVRVVSEDAILGELRARLRQADDKHALARELKLSPYQLTGILRGRWPVPDQVAEKLGYRRVVRFERVD